MSDTGDQVDRNEKRCPHGCGAFHAANGELISDYDYHLLREHDGRIQEATA